MSKQIDIKNENITFNLDNLLSNSKKTTNNYMRLSNFASNNPNLKWYFDKYLNNKNVA